MLPKEQIDFLDDRYDGKFVTNEQLMENNQKIMDKMDKRFEENARKNEHNMLQLKEDIRNSQDQAGKLISFEVKGHCDTLIRDLEIKQSNKVMANVKQFVFIVIGALVGLFLSAIKLK